METNEELEYKILTDKETFYKLVRLYAPLKFEKQENYYYDNNNSKSYAFRIRKKDDQTIFTLKEKVDGKTIEHEKVVDENWENDEDISKLLIEKNINKPYKLLGKLTTYRAVYFDGFGELCFDINCYCNKVDYEIEYEEKVKHDHLKEFIKIIDQVGLKYEKQAKSKYQRFIKELGETKND